MILYTTQFKIQLLYNILDEYERFHPEYLTNILLENNQGKSPLELAIERKSLKCVDIMLNLLSKKEHKRNSKLLSMWFSKLLEFNLKSFYDYLESCIIQTNEMKNTKNLNLKLNMSNSILPHHCSLIESLFIKKYWKDDRNIDEIDNISLYQRSQNKSNQENKANLTIIEIKAIPFEWIFESEGRRNFIASLHNCDDLDIFSLQIVKILIYFLWNSWRYLVFLYLFVPYLIYFSVFVVYVTYIHKNKINSVGNYSDSFGIAEIIWIMIIFMFIIYQLLYEVTQILYNRINYFLSFWNLLDLSSLILNFTVWISDLVGISDEKYVPLSAIAILIVYLKLFYFGRIFISTASMIRMVIFIFYDMKYFLFIFLLVWFAFGNWYYILSKNNISSEAFYENTFFTAFLYAYQQALGAFDVSAFVDEDKHLLFFIWFFNSLILFIILLNMIVAALGDTFDKVQENSSNNSLKEIVSIMYK